MATWGSIRNNTLFSLAKLSSKINNLQEMAASGKRVQKASDSPGEAFRILHLRAEQTAYKTYSKNLDDAITNMDQVSAVMEEISTALQRSQQLLVQGANATLNADNRVAIGNEIDSLLEQMVSMANSKMRGRFLFGGDRLSEMPYDVVRKKDRIASVTYVGSQKELLVPVSPGVEYPGTVVGEDVFGKYLRQDPAFTGTTGAAAGQSTSTVTGDIFFEVIHGTTTILTGGTGITLAANSAADDTIVGNTHELTVNADGTIQLDGGEKVELNGSASLKVQNQRGEKVYIDASAYAGWTGTISLDATAEMTIDDGATTVPVTFTDDQQLQHSGSGKSLFVDTTNLTGAGMDPARVPGTHNVFDTLITVRDAMLNTRSLTEEEQSELLGALTNSLEEATLTFTQNMTSVGSKVQAMDNLKYTLENLQDDSREQSAALEDADIVQVSTDLAHIQSYYQMTLASTAKLLSVSLLDFMH